MTCPITADRDAWRGAVVKLTPAQEAALAKVCRTNGGGVSIQAKWRGDAAVPTDRVMCALFDKGLIQGKAGGIQQVVHTREGLALYRALLARAHTATDAEVDSGDDAPCTDCGGTGWMHQTERHCTCGAPASDAYDA